jgi:SAM-dependent methyltransferase
MDDWAAFQARWARLKPPLRANDEVVAAIGAAIGDAADGRAPALLLGVTPEYAGIAPAMVAVDWSRPMIDGIWPGDDAARRSLCADWRDLPLASGSCGAAVGDGSLSCLAWPDDYRRVFDRLAAVLRPGARLAIRCYATPDPCEPLAAVGAAALAGAAEGFHALKWRIAMALAAARGDPNVPVVAILAAFDTLFPDRGRLAAAAGWDDEEIAEIDAYAGQRLVYSFPTRAEVLARVPPAFAGARFVAAGTYPLAERCPILVAERRR